MDGKLLRSETLNEIESVCALNKREKVSKEVP